MKFELHCHSWHSKGRKIPWEGLASPIMIAKTLHRKGMMGFTITDHDSVNGWKEARAAAKELGMTFIPGLEVSTKSGHLIGLGLSENVRSGLSLEETVDNIRDQGGLSIAPHPFDLKSEGVGREFSKCDAAEVFNSLNLTRIENRIAEREARKITMPMVGGSDAHCLSMLGRTVNSIGAEDMDSALREIKKGKVSIDGSYTPVPVLVCWARERMRMSQKEILHYVSKNYSGPKAALSRLLLRRFVGSQSGLWNGLGYFAVGVSTLYSHLRLVTS